MLQKCVKKDLVRKKVVIFVIVALLLISQTLPVMAAVERYYVRFTEEEQSYIDQCGTITVALSPDNFPYSTMQSGTMTGIFPELLTMLSYETGLQFEILPCDTYEEYSQMKIDRVADIVLATHVTPKEASEVGYRLTSSYFNIPYSKIELRENQSATSKVAALRRPSAEAMEAEKYYYSDQIIYYDSMQQCLDALDQHACEAVISNSYAAEYIQYNDLKNQYVVKELYDNNVKIYAGVSRRCDRNLHKIMEKALFSVDELTKEEIINRNTQQVERSTTMIELLYLNPLIFIGVILIFFFMVCGIIYLIFRIKKSALLQEKSKEYRRFLGYICTAVDTVTELNARERTMVRYTMKYGQLMEEHVSYPEDEWVMFHEDDRNRMKELFTDEKLLYMCNHEETTYEECRMMWNHTGEYHWCNAILQGIRPTREKPFNLLLILKDTNELKMNEEKQRKALEDAFEMAQQASQAKGTFLSKMSHEIRTPLNAIIGYLSLAKDTDGNMDKLMHCVDNSEIAAKHLLHIINDVLDISSIESGKMKIAHEELDLKSEITDISTIFSQNAKNKK